MVKNQLIKIAGIDVSSKVISEETEFLYQEMIDVAVIKFRFDINQLINLSSFQEVTIWENFGGTLETDSNRKFNGEIAKIDREAGIITVKAYSFFWRAIQSEVNQTFDVNIDTEAGVGSEIFITLAGLAGIDADSSSVQSTTPTGIILDKFVCNRAEVFERWQTLADIYGYQFFERYDTLKAHFEPLGFEENSNIIQIGGDDNNVKEFPKWTENATKIFNKVEIIGAFQESNLTKTFNGDGSTTKFTLSKVPEIVEMTVNSVVQTGGVESSTANFDYSVDKSNKNINFVDSSAPGGGTNNVVANFTVREPTPVIKDNEQSISDLGRIIKEKFTFNDIQSVDDAERRADNLLKVYSSPFISTKIKMSPSIVESFNLLVGQSIRVIDNRQLIDRVMVIKKIVTRWPEGDVELEVGDEEIKTTSFEWDSTIRLRRLEEELSRTGDIVRVVKSPNHTLIVDRRDLDVSSQDYDTVAGYSILGLGSSDGYFDLGSGKMGTHDDAFEDEVNHTINQGNNIYNEDFNDTDYKSVSTTATWTGSGSVTFTSGQILQTSSIDKNNGEILTAMLTSTEVSGSFTYEMRADGVNWETVTNNVKHIFANPGTDLQFRAIENVASTGSISNIKIEDYHN